MCLTSWDYLANSCIIGGHPCFFLVLRMNKHSFVRKLSTASGVAAASLLLSQNAYAMPFSPDPISFAGFLNNHRNWYDRSLRIQFQNLGNCEYSYNSGSEAYACYVGYAKITDSISSRLCRVQTWYNFKGNRELDYKEYDCRAQNPRESGGMLYQKAKEWLKRF